MTTKKYELTTTTKVVNRVTLYQIKALKDFESIKNGELGGWIEKESNLSQEEKCWVSGNALVYGNAQVHGNAQVFGSAQVSGNAGVSGDAQVHGNARVYGNAWVYGDAWVYGNARVYGDAWVYGDTQVYGDAWVSGNALVYGNALVSAKMNYTSGRFIGGDDTKKITTLTQEQVGNSYWNVQYALGDVVITPQEEKKPTLSGKTVTVEVDGVKYEAIIK